MRSHPNSDRPWKRGCVHISSTLFTLALLAACGEPREPVGYEVRDSAGIEVVQNFSGAWALGEGWKVDPTPILQLGGEDGHPDANFYRISGIVVLGDGRIVVGNQGTNQLLFFDASGDFLHARGGEGEGPGEFLSLYRLWSFRNDSLLVFDDLANRVSVFDSQGNFARMWRTEIPGGAPFWFFFPRMVSGDGSSFFGTRPEGWTPPRGEVSDSLVYHRFGPGGEYRGTLGTFFWREVYAPPPREQGGNVSVSWVSDLPFARRAQGGPILDGFFFSDSEDYEIGVYQSDGKLLRLVRLAKANREVTNRDKDILRTEWLGEGSDVPGETPYQRWVREMEFPETMPAHGRVKGDSEGNLWVFDYSPPGDSISQVTIFDGEGRMLGTVSMPPGLVVHQIGHDFVAGVWRDQLGVEQVRIHRLTRN
jgi:hypothetical protein